MKVANSPGIVSLVGPVVIENPQDQNVTSFEGTIMLTCVAAGEPIPTITWFQNGTVISDNQDNKTSIMMKENFLDQSISSTLTITMAMVNNSGIYHCNISSSVEYFPDVMSETALVLVQGLFYD